MELTTRFAFPVLEIVKVCAEEAPIETFPKSVTPASTISGTAIPFPMNSIFNVELIREFDVIHNSVRLIPAVEVGEKVPRIVQLELGVKVGVKLGQVPSSTLNMAESPPLISIELMMRSAVPVLEMVRVRGGEVLPRATSPKYSSPEDSMLGAISPDPVNAISSVELTREFETILNVVLLFPGDVGEKVTKMVQSWPGPRLGWRFEQDDVANVNMAASPSVIVMELTARSEVPVLRIKRVYGRELPTATAPKSNVPMPSLITSMLGAAPVPLIVTVTGFSSGSSDVISKLELEGPTAVGANLMVRVQLPPPGARGIPFAQVPSPATLLNGSAGDPIVPR